MTTPIMQCLHPNSNHIYIKRDDLIPFSFGGNKVRIANEFFADMKKKNCDCIIGYGNARSNLCRIIANMSKYYGIKCYIVSPLDNDGTRTETANSLIVNACGAETVLCKKEDVAQTLEHTMELCKKNGYRPYYINGDSHGNGNEAVPVKAYAKAYQEIKDYETENNIIFDYIFCALGTGMTYSGLLAGKTAVHDPVKIIGISIARETEKEKPIIEKYLNCYFSVSAHWDFEITDKYLCGGYAKYNQDIIDTIKNMLLKEGISLDPTYTGKAFWGMQQYLAEHAEKNKNVLFLHTGSAPLFFDNIKRILGCDKV